jgi:hypothetical protein
MNNNDRYTIAMRTDPLEAASLAIEFSSGCGSKSAAWNWADRAIAAAARAGVTLDAGNLSWPELDSMKAQLKAVRP